VITRAEASRSYRGVEQVLRLHNPRAPIFKARVSPEFWVDLQSGERIPPESLPFARVAAFCGLASPASFWRTLGSLGYQPARLWGFGDHHRYRPAELSRLGAAARQLGVDALLTTEKDAMNLCEQAASLIAPIRLYWLKIGIEVEEEDRLLGIILSNDASKPVRRRGFCG
jgi:tetraacyldisaccharide 4'-kinase